MGKIAVLCPDWAVKFYLCSPVRSNENVCVGPVLICIRRSLFFSPPHLNRVIGCAVLSFSVSCETLLMKLELQRDEYVISQEVCDVCRCLLHIYFVIILGRKKVSWKLFNERIYGGSGSQCVIIKFGLHFYVRKRL